MPKSHPLVVACGDLDELNASLGLAASLTDEARWLELLRRMQSWIFAIGADVAASAGEPSEKLVSGDLVAAAEAMIDRLDTELPALDSFILPGGSPFGAALHLARAVCRRAERAVAAASRDHAVPPEALALLNRLSDLLFVMARAANREMGTPEMPWRREN